MKDKLYANFKLDTQTMHYVLTIQNPSNMEETLTKRYCASWFTNAMALLFKENESDKCYDAVVFDSIVDTIRGLAEERFGVKKNKKYRAYFKQVSETEQSFAIS